MNSNHADQLALIGQFLNTESALKAAEDFSKSNPEWLEIPEKIEDAQTASQYALYGFLCWAAQELGRRDENGEPAPQTDERCPEICLEHVFNLALAAFIKTAPLRLNKTKQALQIPPTLLYGGAPKGGRPERHTESTYIALEMASRTLEGKSLVEATKCDLLIELGGERRRNIDSETLRRYLVGDKSHIKRDWKLLLDVFELRAKTGTPFTDTEKQKIANAFHVEWRPAASLQDVLRERQTKNITTGQL